MTKKTRTRTPSQQLADALARASKIVPRRSALPILTCVRVHVIPRVSTCDIVIDATDMDVWTSETVYGLPYAAPAIGAPTSVCVDARHAAAGAKTAATMGETAVVIVPGEHDGAPVLRIGPVALATMPAADYPAPPAPTETVVRVEIPDLTAAIDIVRAYASTEETRYYLRGVCVRTRPQNGGVDIVATDGHRLARYYANAYGPAVEAPEINVIIPNGALDALRGADALTVWTASKGTQYVRASVGERTITAACIDGTFPAYERVIPSKKSDGKTPVSEAPCDTAALASAAQNMVKLVGKDRAVVWSGDALSSAPTSDGAASIGASLPCAGAVCPISSIGFDPRYLAGLADTFDGQGAVTCYATDAGSPMLWEAGRLQAVIMPRRI